MGFIKKNLLKVIECSNFTENSLVYKFICPDRYEIMKGSKLIVRPSQAAIFVHKGQVCDVFTEGQYSLDTSNLPILSKIASIIYAFEMPNLTDIYFVNLVQFTGMKWGTTAPVMLRDKDFGVVRLQTHGEYAFRIAKPETFMREYFGTLKTCTSDRIQEYLKSFVVSEFSDTLGEAGIPALDLASKYIELSMLVRNNLTQRFASLGLEITEVVIKNIKLPEEVEKVLDKRTSIGIMGDVMGDYATYESVGAMRDAAKNKGTGGMFAGLGVGMGAGGALGSTFASSLNNAKNKAKCSNCGHLVDEGTKFCPSCGKPIAPAGSIQCSNCSKPIPQGARFCPSCGTATSVTCPKCGKVHPIGTNFCPDCGTKLQ